MNEQESNKINRRGFWRGLFGFAVISCDELRGCKHLPMNQLCELGDSEIAKICPFFFDGINYHDGVIFHAANSTAPDQNKVLFQADDDMTQWFLSQFGTRMSIEELAEIWADRYELPYQEVFDQMRTFFLQLAKRNICHPDAAMESI